MAGARANRQKTTWKQDPEAVKADILRVAISEFAKNGLSGARINEIADRTSVSKRMIYYYFGDKDGLYRRALEAAYAEMRTEEDALELSDLDPVSALERLVEFTFEHHRNSPDFIRLVMNENVHNAAYLRESETIRNLNISAIEKLGELCARGQRQGVFRPDIDPLELHWHISALSFFNVSNRATFTVIFGHRLETEQGQASLKRHAVASVLRTVLVTPE